MADSLAPEDWWSGYTSDGTTISIPLATLGLTAEQALDWRFFLYRFIEATLTHYRAMTNKPVALQMLTPSAIVEYASDLRGTVQMRYAVVFYLDYTATNVAGEPLL